MRWSTLRHSGGQWSGREDVLTVEGPVEYRIGGVPIAVLMRTPGRDAPLGLGFLLTEGIVIEPDEVASIHPVEDTASGDRYDIELADGVIIDPEQFRRNMFVSSSCGVCGKASIESVMIARRTPPSGPTVPPSFVTSLPGKMRDHQRQFDETGSLHAAAAVLADGTLLALEEDVGRHNAVDKVVGVLASGAWPPSELILVVSGRIGFEITQKAAVVGIPIVAGISGASSLAIELGREAGMTVIGFVRDDGFNLYTGAERVETS
ncbi:MAG: formate dehydrogenase accessory sulfurtransferase FdhD [Acidimicrobiia bacterium]